MNVILNVRDLNTGGAERVAVLLARGMRALGHNIVIAVCKMHPGDSGRFSDLHLVDLHVEKPLMEARALAALIAKIRPDVVIAFGIVVGIGAAFSRLLWSTGTKLIIRNENNLIEEWRLAKGHNRIIGPPLSRWAARHSHLVTVSKALAQASAEYLSIPTARITTIPNPVIDNTMPVEHVVDAPLHPWLQDRSRPTFVAMGRLEHQKGFDVLIDAFAKVQQQSEARLVIFGEGSLRGQLQAKIETGCLGDAITLAGHTNQAIAQMRAAHAFILSSRFEGFGLVLVEALWAGTRVIATNCDYGPAEVLENGRYGVLVPVADPTALGEAMLNSLHDKKPKLSPANAWFAQFTATEAAHQHIALIESIIARQSLSSS